jgi:hypothetical protein
MFIIMKTVSLIIFLFLSVNVAQAQLTYIPDDAFEFYIETYINGASNGNITDNYVNTSAIQAPVSLNLSPATIPVGQIGDLTGIQDFSNLIGFGIANQAVTTIDLSPINTSIGSSQIPFGFMVTNCQNVTNIVLPNVTFLRFTCQNNQYLENITFQNSNIISLGLILTLNTSLQVFDISNTAGTENTISLLIQSNTNLTCLNLKNGGCSNYSQVAILGNGFNNPIAPQSSLNCITVDNPSIQSFNWSWVEYLNDPSIYSYSTNCGCSLSLDEAMKEISISPNPILTELTISIENDFIGKTYTISTLAGEILMRGQLEGTQESISLAHISEGVYLFTVDHAQPVRFVKM